MPVDVDEILGLIGHDRVNKEVLLKHDYARETFKLPKIVVENAQEFKYLVTSYIEHHESEVGGGKPSPEAAFGEAKGILDRAFEEDRYQEGYAHALQMALDGTNGGMRTVLNALAESLKRRALGNYLDHVYHQHVNVLSKEDNLALSRAFYQRFGPILQRYGIQVTEDTFAWNSRAALDYHRQIIEQITGIAKKI